MFFCILVELIMILSLLPLSLALLLLSLSLSLSLSASELLTSPFGPFIYSFILKISSSAYKGKEKKISFIVIKSKYTK